MAWHSSTPGISSTDISSTDTGLACWVLGLVQLVLLLMMIMMRFKLLLLLLLVFLQADLQL